MLYFLHPYRETNHHQNLVFFTKAPNDQSIFLQRMKIEIEMVGALLPPLQVLSSVGATR